MWLGGGGERSVPGGKKRRAISNRHRTGLASQMVARPLKASVDGFEWWDMKRGIDFEA